MSRKNQQPAALPVSSSDNAWDIATGVLVCVVIFLVTFLPDEKLVRLKLQAFELGVYFLAGVVVLRSLLNGRVPPILAPLTLPSPPAKNVEGEGICEFPLPPCRVWGERVRVRGALLLCGAVLVWVAVNAGLWVFAPEKSLASAELRRVLLAAGAFFGFALSDLTENWRRRFLFVWSFSGGLIGLYGILQVTGGIGRVMVPQIPRVMGTFGNPIFFAAYLLVTIFVTLQAWRGAGKIWLKFLLSLCLITELIALAFTQTRAAMVALLSVTIIGSVHRFGLKKIPSWLPVFVLVIFGAFAYQTKNLWQRDQGHLLIWRDTLRMWADHPVKGVGLGAFHTNFSTYAQDDLKQKWPQGQVIINYAHNEYLQVLAEGGALALLSFLAIFFFYFRPARGLPALGVAAILIQNFFSVDIRFSVSLATCFMLMGLSISAAKQEDEAWAPKILHSRGGRYVAALMWCAVMAMPLPRVLKPYRAQREVSAMPNFFDQRLLDPAQSIQDLEKLAHAYPEQIAVLEKLAYVYAKEIKDAGGKIDPVMVNHSLKIYARIIALDDKNAGAYNNSANILYTTGRSEEAIKMWQRATAVKPDFLDPHLNLGKILYAQGRLKEAAAHFETVLKIDSTNAEAIVYLKRMVE